VDSTCPASPPSALILLGDEYLLAQLQLRNHRALCSRLSAHHLLSPWTLEEIQTYLTTGLQAVGIHRTKVFEPGRRSNCWCAPTAGRARAASAFWRRAAWLEAARARVAREIGAPTMQLAMEQVPGVARLDSPQLHDRAHSTGSRLICRLTDQRVSLRFERERLWVMSSSTRASTRADLQKVIRYLQRARRFVKGAGNVGALKLSKSPAIGPLRRGSQYQSRSALPSQSPTIASSIAGSASHAKQSRGRPKPAPPACLTNPGPLSGGAKLIASHARFRNCLPRPSPHPSLDTNPRRRPRSTLENLHHAPPRSFLRRAM